MSKSIKSSSQIHSKTKEDPPLNDPANSKATKHTANSLSTSHNNSEKILQKKTESSRNVQLNNPQNLSDNSKSKSDNSGIIEVYEDNFIQEIKNIARFLDEYNYIGMDTEFPGTVYCVPNISDDFYYKTLKLNCDNLKLIQLGITLTNSKGEFPKDYPYHTWQFNFEFDTSKDQFSQSSMNLLLNSGIDFAKLKSKGIKHKVFADYFMVSGLVLNEDVHWVSFQGSYDFGYLLRLLLNTDLPESEEEFMDDLDTYFHNFYDIRNYVKGKDNLQGSLNRLAQNLEVLREGQIHQAGSDSAVTIDVFLKLIKNKVIDEDKLKERKNTLFGICNREDNNETINYLLTSGAAGSIKFAQSAAAANNYYSQKYDKYESAEKIANNNYNISNMNNHGMINNDMSRMGLYNNLGANSIGMMNIGNIGNIGGISNLSNINYYYPTSRRILMNNSEYSPSPNGHYM